MERISIQISYESLTKYSRKIFQIHRFVQNIRHILSMLGQEDVNLLDEIRFTFSPKMEEKKLIRAWIINSYPVMKNEVTEPWNILQKLLTVQDDRFRTLNAIVQMNLVSFSPLTMYYRLLMEENRDFVMMNYTLYKQGKESGAVNPLQTWVTGMTYVPSYSQGTLSVMYQEPVQDEENSNETESVIREGFPDEFQTGDKDEINIQYDFPSGFCLNLNSKFPVYVFPLRSLVSTIHAIREMEKSGLAVIPIQPTENLDEETLMQIHSDFCKQWGIELVDMVGSSRWGRTMEKHMPMLVEGGEIPPIIVIRRPYNLFHDTKWASATSIRIRGLGLGLPWAETFEDGHSINRPFADDGFINYFYMEGFENFRAGKPIEFYFSLPTSIPYPRLKSLCGKLWDFEYSMNLKHYPEEQVYSIEIYKGIDWIRFRAILRSILLL